MPLREQVLSGYETMWLFALFDLPVVTKADRKRYAQFRTLLLREGFSQLQYSVYARCCPGEESGAHLQRRLERLAPPAGQVRMLMITDRQFGKMIVLEGKKHVRPERALPQMLLF